MSIGIESTKACPPFVFLFIHFLDALFFSPQVGPLHPPIFHNSTSVPKSRRTGEHSGRGTEQEDG